MKTNILSAITLAVAALSLASCSDTWEPTSATTGDVNLASLAVEVSEAETVISKASGRAVVDVSDYIVTIYSEAGAQQKEWTFAEMPEIFSLPVGNYTVKVKSHAVEKHAWDKPYYEGEKDFSIATGKITDIGAVKCTFQALKVTVKFDEKLREKMGSDVEVTVIANDEGRLTFTPDETRSAYFDVHPANGEANTVVATFVGTVNGYKENIRKTYTGVKRGDHYILTFKFRNNTLEPDDEVGHVDPSDGVNVDTSFEHDNVNGTVGNDEDVIDGDGTYNDEHFTEKIEGDYDAASATATFSATAEIAKIMMAVQSDDATFSRLDGVDLLNPGSAASLVSEYGLTPAVFSRANAYTVNFSKFIAALKEVEGTHSFSVSATDAENNTTEAIKVEVEGNAGGDEPEQPGQDAVSFSVPDPDSNAFMLNTKMTLTQQGETTLINGSSAYNGVVYITAPAKIKNLYLTIKSDPDPDDFESEVGGMFGSNCDFANPGDMADSIDALGLPYGDALTKTEVVEFDINSFIPLIPNFGGVHTFNITVTDNNGQSNSTSLIFEVAQ